MEEQIITNETALLATKKKIYVGRCTQAVLQRILREKYGIHIVLIPTVTSSWTYKTVGVLSERDNDVIKGIKSVDSLPPYEGVCGYDFSTYEQALENAMSESLNLITI